MLSEECIHNNEDELEENYIDAVIRNDLPKRVLVLSSKKCLKIVRKFKN